MVRLVYPMAIVQQPGIQSAQPEQLKIFAHDCSNRTIDARDTVLPIHYRVERSSQPTLTKLPSS